jgi:hypothetical protein
MGHLLELSGQLQVLAAQHVCGAVRLGELGLEGSAAGGQVCVVCLQLRQAQAGLLLSLGALTRHITP